MKSRTFATLLASSLLSLVAQPATALELIYPTLAGGAGVGFSQQFPAREAINIVNGSGIVGAVTPSSVHQGNVSPDGIMWHTNGTPSGFIVFDLGAQWYKVNTAHIWQFAEANNLNRGTQLLNISVSTDSNPITAIYSQVIGPEIGGAFKMTQESIGDSTVEAQSFSLSGALNNVRLIRFDILSNYGASSYVGLSEVIFDGQLVLPPVVPEPSTFALLGLGAAGLACRRRRQAQ